VTTSAWFSQSGFADDEVGDQFGASLASVQHPILFSPAQLFVGVPVEGMNGEDVEAGVVQRFTVTGNAFSHNAMIRESPGGAEEEGDEFGRAVAVHGTPAGTFIFVGAPGENNESGAVYVLGALGNVAPGHRQVLVQHGKGTHAAP
jgi:hypothetical protein